MRPTTLLLLLLLAAAAVSGRRHRYGMHGARKRHREEILKRSHAEQSTPEVSEGGYDGDEGEEEMESMSIIDSASINSIMESQKRLPPRPPGAINPEPYLIAGALWLSTTLFG